MQPALFHERIEDAAPHDRLLADDLADVPVRSAGRSGGAGRSRRAGRGRHAGTAARLSIIALTWASV